ncbi:ABC transporter ATP-binding protein [Kaistia dalseonensis]|uniref:ATP-binding cassette subfamily B protein n=1 Tax=Kaistia dalseonensis TaxID=410840 RepID=A0ABU0HBA7_9HYPH|nr:ABC transporter ATP-binding protein [Kaistia dalseonensis]MCX5496166.1 ABC transporter ATP-binding protein [Kaistia dalseonensis]MDQ0438776.1 ATP-binding cassette subfamily B protein [Kaistia dalseonensis]
MTQTEANTLPENGSEPARQNGFSRRWSAFRAAMADESGTIGLVGRILRGNFRNHWRGYTISFIFLFIVAAMTSLSAWIMRDVVNQIFVKQDVEMLWVLSFGVMAIFIVKGAATYGQMVVQSRIGNRIVAENQKRFYERCLKFGLDFFTDRASSELIMSVSAGANAIRNILDTIVVSVGRDFVSLAGLVFVMVYQAPLMTVIALLIAPPAIFGVSRLVKRIKGIAKAEFTAGVQIIAIIQETVQGAKIVKAFGLGDHMQNRMATAVESVEKRANKISQLQARTSPLMESLGGIAIGVVILYAGWATISSGKTPGEFMSFVTALLLAYEPAKRLARVNVGIAESMIAVRMLFGVLDTPPSVTEADDKPPLTLTRGRIDLTDVVFGYRKTEPVVNGVTLSVGHGQRLALVGPSGGGKSTLLALIQRFYDVDKGAISVDGQDIRSVAVASLRHHIAFVSQDVFLFAGTARDNIRIGRLGATDEEVEQAARDAFAHDFIMGLPNGYDSHVGENGVQLSGGQRQRMAIARAILKNAPILLLDEATSALDSESERMIQIALDKLVEGRTTIVIAHRLATILSADKIAVIEHGRVLESGTHAELVRRGGLYEKLYRYQFAEAEPLERASA